MRSIDLLLNARGFSVAIDDSFGTNTKTAVIKFQRSRGLAADGIVGSMTWEKLIITLKRGSGGYSVRALQWQLRANSCSGVEVNGYFGPYTESAVKRFQSANGLVSDGIVGPVTWNRLVRGGPCVVTRTAIQPVTGTVTGYLYYRCGSGADGDHYGIDLGTGTSNPPVVTTAAGKVKFVGYAGGAGNLVEIQHGNGYVSRYMHLRNFASGLAAGQAKARGALIGYAGNTGASQGNHLHFEIRKNGSPVNFRSAYRCGQSVTKGTTINYSFLGI